MKDKLFNFLNPIISFIDKGLIYKEPIKWLYIGIGVLCCISPLSFLIAMTSLGFFRYSSASAIILAFLFFIVLCIGGWGSFVYWWRRKNQLKDVIDLNDHYIAITTISSFVKSLGDWLGLYIGFIGTLLAFIAEIGGLTQFYEIPFLNSFMLRTIVICPIAGLIIIILGRFIAEFLRILVDIANNTRRHYRQ